MVRAAVSTASLQAEQGTRTTQATVVSDTTASAGQAVKFGSAPAGGGTPTNCTSYSGTQNITSGGTYTGCWNSVTVNTTAAVTIQNCGVKATSSSYNLIQINSGANVTIRNCYLEGWPTASNNGPRGIWCAGCSTLTVEYNEFLHIAALKAGNASNIVLKFTNNKIRDIIGDETNCCGGGYAPAMQLYEGTFTKTVIAWNEIINTAGNSNMEDGLNTFNAGGLSSTDPIDVNNNFIWGAYPNPITDPYSGGGMLTGDGNGTTNNIYVTNNQLIATTNYGLQIGGGTNNRFNNNRVVASGRTSTGQVINAMNVGLVLWTYSTPPSNSQMNNNVVGFMRPPNSSYEPTNGTWHRVDYWCPAAGSNGNTCTGNTSLTADPKAIITYADEQAEYTLWQQKLAANGVKVGRQ